MAHGMTAQQVFDLQQKQIFGEELETIQANKSSKHKVNAHEAHLTHAIIENTEFDSKSGERKSKPSLQKFYPNDFSKMVEEKAFQGYEVNVIHDGAIYAASKNAQAAANTIATPTPAAVKDFVPEILSAPRENKTILEQFEENISVKVLDKMNKAELISTYTLVYEAAPEDMTNKELIESITERVDFLKAE